MMSHQNNTRRSELHVNDINYSEQYKMGGMSRAGNDGPYSDAYKINNVTYYYLPNYDEDENSGFRTYGNSYPDVDRMKSMWKKERNRLAAKKSRDKKAVHLRELEFREKKMEMDNINMKQALADYDNVLNGIIKYMESILNTNSQDNMVSLFDCLCKLKKPGSDDEDYIKDVSNLVDKPLMVTNQRIERLTMHIKKNLNEMIQRKNVGEL